MNSLKKIFDRDTWDEIFESISKNRTRTVITTIGLDHLDWLPKNEQTLDKIIFEKTSSLLNQLLSFMSYIILEIDQGFHPLIL